MSKQLFEAQSQAPKQLFNDPPQAPKQSPEAESQVKLRQEIEKFGKELDSLKQDVDFNSEYVNLMNGVNELRLKFEEIREIHELHRGAADSIKSEIDNLDLGMLENLYLIEFIKSRGSRMRTIDPIAFRSVDNIKNQMKTIKAKLEDLNNLVDFSWEDFVRRKKNRGKRLNSLSIVYRTMATNHKVIKALKKRVPLITEESVKHQTREAKPVIKRINSDKMDAFRNFLAARETVPVRQSSQDSVLHC